MTIDIDQPTEAELVDLNHRVVARLGLPACPANSQVSIAHRSGIVP